MKQAKRNTAGVRERAKKVLTGVEALAKKIRSGAGARAKEILGGPKSHGKEVYWRLAKRGLQDALVNPWGQATTLAAVTLVAFLGGFFLMFLHNLDLELHRTRGDILYQLYWKPRSDLNKIKAQWEGFDKLPHLSEKKTFTSEQALKALSESLGKDLDLDWIKEQSPLPPTALLTFIPPQKDRQAWTDEMRKRLESLPEVEKVQSSTMGAELLEAWGKTTRRFIWPLIFFLGCVFALVVGNTMKLALLARRDEIEILQLVGARTWYIRLPLLVNGGLHGFVGSILSLSLLKIVQLGLENFLNFSPIYLKIRFLPFGYAFLLVAGLTLAAVASCYAAVRE